MNSQLFFLIAIVLLGLGVVLLIASLFPIREIIRRLPKGTLRKRWFLLLSFSVLFLFSYIVYGGVFWNQFDNLVDLIVPGVFFFGACFVWLISTLSLQTTLVIRQVYRLEEESITDSLTGVYNRRYLDRRLGEEFSHAKQFSSNLAILLIDIDHFKKINDKAGHFVGDQVIKQIAKIMQTTIRGSDVLVRFGGDEFIIIALNTSADAAGGFAEKILRRIHSHPIEVNNEKNATIKLQVTVSVGVASLSNDITDINQFIQNADKALYCSKKQGRNQISIYTANSD